MTKDEFFDLGFSDSVAVRLEALMLEGNVKAFSASRNADGQLRVRAWADLPNEWDTDMVFIFGQPEPEPIEQPGPTAVSRTQQALKLIDNGWSAYRAAKFVGLSQAAISRARKRREGRNCCPHCGQLMKS